MKDKRPEFPTGIILTSEMIHRIKSDQEYWDRKHGYKKEG